MYFSLAKYFYSFFQFVIIFTGLFFRPVFFCSFWEIILNQNQHQHAFTLLLTDILIIFFFAHQVEEEDKTAPLIVVSPAHLINYYEKCLQDNNYFGMNSEKVMPFIALVCTQ